MATASVPCPQCKEPIPLECYGRREPDGSWAMVIRSEPIREHIAGHKRGQGTCLEGKGVVN